MLANDQIYFIYTDALSNVYAGGDFTNASGKRYVGKWDGTSWSELGGLNGLSPNNSINSICTDVLGNVYVAGGFTNTSNKKYVARWNGNTWSELGGLNGLSANNSIYSICIDTSGNIYAAGYFTNLNGKNYVAKWNGISWSELGGLNGLSANGYILSICTDASGNIYASGGFNNSNSKRYIAKWNGSSWSELGGSNSSSANNWINSICNDAIGNIYKAGDFTNSNGKYYVAKYGQLSSNTINGRIKTPLSKLIKKATLNCLGSSASSTIVDSTGNYNFNLNAGNYTLRPTKNNDIAKANGVTSIDALLTQRHILNIAKLNSPYKIIAADVNGDRQINSVDVLRIKRLILGTDTTFTSSTKGNRLWEFVDSAYQFSDSTNPFPFKDSISFTNLTSNKINQTFIGVKLGDVNYDWNPTVARGSTVNSIQLTENIGSKVVNGELRIPITVNNFKDIVAMQYTLHFNNKDYEFVGIENNNLDIDFNSKQANQNGNISMLWTDKTATERTLDDGAEIFVLVLKQKGTGNLELGISDAITAIEAWDKDYNQHKVILLKREIITNNSTLTTSQWSVSPNPTSVEIKVSIASKTNKTASFELTDAQGKTILKQSVELQKGTNNFAMNLKQNGNLTTGVYFLKADGIEGENVKRIMVK